MSSEAEALTLVELRSLLLDWTVDAADRAQVDQYVRSLSVQDIQLHAVSTECLQSTYRRRSRRDTSVLGLREFCRKLEVTRQSEVLYGMVSTDAAVLSIWLSTPGRSLIGATFGRVQHHRQL
ncbi:hypothetical protein [Homoserinibacter sp. YIM 151385]|uniref:hypothetical protein n=1 Tax=Homoserinibacter sp. YIM 151385 TaxID=2985506 RepID=UPI0022EFF081|nr:hypothetical protein [Homoserinibacter sp. YIM 151385]WBU37541.1 hypothetical protein OF852_11540 [Homoserinibacter sp. YIM 151385]